MTEFTLPPGWRARNEERGGYDRDRSEMAMVLLEPAKPSSVGIAILFFENPDATALIEDRVRRVGNPIRGPVYTTGSSAIVVGNGTYIGGRPAATARWLAANGKEISDVFYVELPEHGGTVVFDVVGLPEHIGEHAAAIKKVLTSVTFVAPRPGPKPIARWGVYFYSGPFELVLGAEESVDSGDAAQLPDYLRGKKVRRFLVVDRNGRRYEGLAFLMTTAAARASGVMDQPGQSVLLFDGVQECHLRLGAPQMDLNCASGSVPANPPVRLTLRR
jgi:hypothetical protein